MGRTAGDHNGPGGVRRAIDLGFVGVDRQQRARHLHRQVQLSARPQTPIVDIAAGFERRNGVHEACGVRRQADDAKMRSDRDLDPLKDIVAALDRRRIDPHAGIVHAGVHDAGGVGLGRPAIGIERVGAGAGSAGRPFLKAPRSPCMIHFVDGHDLPRLGLGQEIFVL